MNFYTVDILTPEKIVAKDVPAESILVPTVRGQINILENHTHIINRLSVGQLSIFGGPNDDDRHFTVSSGICKILDKKVIILSHESIEHHDIILDDAKVELNNAEMKLSSESLGDDEIELYQHKAEMARLKIQMTSHTNNPKL